MRRIIVSTVTVLSSAALISCATSGNTSYTPTPSSIAGSWEFVASSSTSAGTMTGIEVALTEGTVQVNGINQPDGNISAAGGNQIAFISLNTAPKVQFVPNCPGTGVNSLAGTVANPGGPVNFAYTENGNVFNVTAVLSTDGNTITGTYAPETGNPCVDSGTIVGTKIGKITGTYNGQLTLPDGTSPAVDGSATQSGGTLTLTVTNTTNNAGFSLNGPVMGNEFSVQGTYQGQLSAYYGYYEVVKGTPTLYMANAANPATPVYAGSLAAPPVP